MTPSTEEYTNHSSSDPCLRDERTILESGGVYNNNNSVEPTNSIILQETQLVGQQVQQGKSTVETNEDNITQNIAQYKETGYHSTTDSHTSSSLDYTAEALYVVDSHQPVHKNIQLGLCKGLFGMHIRRGRGRPRKFNPSSTYKTKTKRMTKSMNKRAKDRHIQLQTHENDEVQATHTEDNNCQQIIIFDKLGNKTKLANCILQDAFDMGLELKTDQEETIQRILSVL